MALLSELAITPSVFSEGSYSEPGICDAHILAIRELLLHWILVRDLHGGKWFQDITEDRLLFRKAGRELVAKLARRNRLTRAVPESDQPPADPGGWVQEALRSHRRSPVAGILTCPKGKCAAAVESLVVSIDNRLACPWWQEAVVRTGWRVARNTQSYLTQLSLVLRYATHIMFIDPHLDPASHGYREFSRLLEAAARADGVHPRLEIHRVCYDGSGGARRILKRTDLEARFRESLEPSLVKLGMRIEIFVWSEGHDRHLLSNLVGIHMGNGFNVTKDPSARSTWTRLDRQSSDDIQREFDPAVHPGRLYHRFIIGEGKSDP